MNFALIAKNLQRHGNGWNSLEELLALSPTRWRGCRVFTGNLGAEQGRCIRLAVKTLHSIDKNFESSWYALGQLVVGRLEMNTCTNQMYSVPNRSHYSRSQPGASGTVEIPYKVPIQDDILNERAKGEMTMNETKGNGINWTLLLPSYSYITKNSRAERTRRPASQLDSSFQQEYRYIAYYHI